MRVIGIDVLAMYCEKESKCKSWVSAWLSDLRGMGVPSIEEILNRFPSAVLKRGRLIIFTFSIDEVQYFMKVQVAQGAGVMVVKWLGNAVEYTDYMAEVGHGN